MEISNTQKLPSFFHIRFYPRYSYHDGHSTRSASARYVALSESGVPHVIVIGDQDGWKQFHRNWTVVGTPRML
jgi:hypothetical protein